MNTAVSADGRVAVFALSGEFDLGTTDIVWPGLARLLATAAEVVVLDGTALEFMDSSGLRVLLRGAKLAESEGTAFRVVAPHPVVQRVLELAGARHALDVRASLAEAVA
ncbi:MAG TPA: STAS domain-containing protein [Actinospica sp.]|nr:STAS domain-containing protein [Actinospica sp.]